MRALSCFFALSCLTFSSQSSFHLSLRPRRASTFFRKESRQRFAKGLRPFEPHSCALRPIFFSSALLAGLAALWAANRRQIRETLEKPRSKAQLFKRFCAKGNACALSLISPFFWLLAGLSGPSAANRRLAGETPEKPKEQSSAFRAFLCVGDAPGLFSAWKNRSSARARTRNQLRACAARRRKRQGARLAHRRCAGVRDAGKKQTGQTALQAADALQAATRVTSLPLQTALRRDGACANCSPQARAFSLPGKQKLGEGSHPETTACVRGWAKAQTRCANCPAQPRRRVVKGV